MTRSGVLMASAYLLNAAVNIKLPAKPILMTAVAGVLTILNTG